MGKRIAVITGASSGMGREFARQIDLLQQSDELWLIARNADALAAVAASLTTPARCLPADLTDADDRRRVAATIDAEAPLITYLVNAAGFGKFGDWRAIDEADAEAMIELNCRALVAMTRACLPHMARGSRVIQLCSASAFTPLPHLNVLRPQLHARPALGAPRHRHHRHRRVPHLGENRVREGGARLGRRPGRAAPARRPAGLHGRLPRAGRQPRPPGRGHVQPPGPRPARAGQGAPPLRDDGRLGGGAPPLAPGRRAGAARVGHRAVARARARSAPRGPTAARPPSPPSRVRPAPGPPP